MFGDDLNDSEMESQFNLDLNEKMCSASFEAKSTSVWENFLYTLMRDHLPAGQVESIVREVLLHREYEIRFTNGWLHAYAAYCAKRLNSTQ